MTHKQIIRETLIAILATLIDTSAENEIQKDGFIMLKYVTEAHDELKKKEDMS